MLIKCAADIRSSEITDKKLYLNRREFIRATSVTAGAAAAGVLGAEALVEAKGAPHGRKLENIKKSSFSTTEKLNAWEDITSYNNYYEFGVDKDAPADMARNFKPAPWTVTVEGECNKKGAMNLEDVLECFTLEDVLEVHCAFLVALALDRHRPRRRLEVPRHVGRRVLVDAELVIVVVAGDVFPRVQLFRGAEAALFDVLQLASVRRAFRLDERFGAEHACGGRGSRDGRRADELAPVQIQLLVRDFRASDVCRALNQHEDILTVRATPLRNTEESDGDDVPSLAPSRRVPTGAPMAPLDRMPGAAGRLREAGARGRRLP